MNKVTSYLKELREAFVNSKSYQFYAFSIISVIFYSLSPIRPVAVMTPSIDTGIYLFNAFDDGRKRYSKHCFDNHRPEWVDDRLKIPTHQLSCKVLLGVPGDEITVEGNVIKIKYESSDITRPFEVLQYERLASFNDAPLMFESLPKVIPEGKYYFGSDYEYGWDSRYIGLVEESDIKGAVKILLPF